MRKFLQNNILILLVFLFLFFTFLERYVCPNCYKGFYYAIIILIPILTAIQFAIWIKIKFYKAILIHIPLVLLQFLALFLKGDFAHYLWIAVVILFLLTIQIFIWTIILFMKIYKLSRSK